MRDVLDNVDSILRTLMPLEVRLLVECIREEQVAVAERLHTRDDLEYALLQRLIGKAAELVKWRRVGVEEWGVMGYMVRLRMASIELERRVEDERVVRRCNCEYCAEFGK